LRRIALSNFTGNGHKRSGPLPGLQWGKLFDKDGGPALPIFEAGTETQSEREKIMASLTKQKTDTGTRYNIQLSPGEDERRPKIHLGAVTGRQAQSALSHIETLLKCRKTGDVMPTATQEWLNGIPDGLRSRLEKLALVEIRAKNRWTVAAWVADYIARRPDVKEGTRRKWRDVQGKLAAFFRNDTIGDVTIQHAKAFRVYLQTTVGLSENTLRRHIGIARQFFNAAIEAEIIVKNPFRGQSVSLRANEARFYYVNPETAQAVLEACPDAAWRLLFGLARYGGLRCPSEVLRLKWQDVDFAKERFTVHSSKTEHHADGGIRTVPMFPELKPLFRDAFEQAKDGAVYCIDRYKGQWSNVGVHMARIIKHAGVNVWPKLFQNCRSTRETELFKLTGGNIKAVCKWLGNSPAVAMAHYAQVTEADMQQAAKKAVMIDAENALEKEVHNQVHNPVQNTSEPGCTEPHDTPAELTVTPCDCDSKQQFATPCESVRNPHNWAILDLNGNSQGAVNKELIANSKMPEVQNPVHVLQKYPDLAELVDRWPNLPESIRGEILRLAGKTP